MDDRNRPDDLESRAAKLLDMETARRKRKSGAKEKSPGNGKQPSEKPSGKQSDALVKLAMEHCEFWHDPQGEPFATVLAADIRAHYGMVGASFKQWLAFRYYQEYQLAPSANGIVEALAVLSGKARFEGPEHPTARRIGRHENKLYLDLGNETWQAVEIDAEDWRIVKDPPIHFIRSKAMRPLPLPEPGGTIAPLWDLLNIDVQDRPLIYGWLAAALREDRWPYPILATIGSQGSAKSFTARVLKNLLDPNVSPLRTVPRDEEALFVAARSGHVIAFDNVSAHGFKDWLSDALCRLATGGGLSKREQYSDGNEFVLPDTRRPILMTSIDMFVGRQDLLDRTFLVNLPTILPDNRERESVLEERFQLAHPRLLGALLDGAVCALAQEPHSAPPALPRMADAAKWIHGAELALGQPGAFLQAFRSTHLENVQAALEMTPLYDLLRRWLNKQPGKTWKGSAKKLLAALKCSADSTKLPPDPTRLSSALTRLEAALRVVGIQITRNRDSSGRWMTISYL